MKPENVDCNLIVNFELKNFFVNMTFSFGIGKKLCYILVFIVVNLESFMFCWERCMLYEKNKCVRNVDSFAYIEMCTWVKDEKFIFEWMPK